MNPCTVLRCHKHFKNQYNQFISSNFVLCVGIHELYLCHSDTIRTATVTAVTWPVRTVPKWNTLPEACVNADTNTAFQAQLRHTPNVVIRESGLTITELELELELLSFHSMCIPPVLIAEIRANKNISCYPSVHAGRSKWWRSTVFKTPAKGRPLVTRVTASWCGCCDPQTTHRLSISLPATSLWCLRTSTCLRSWRHGPS